YEWVVYTPELFNDTRLVRFPTNSSQIFVVAHLVYDNGREIPCEGLIDIAKRTFEPVVRHNDNHTRVEVLLINSGKAKWIPSSNGVVLDNAIVGGKLRTNEKMQPSVHSCVWDFWNYEDKNYSLLIHEQ
ncbi:hypothetical protein PV325_007446, partial [Microctonus aethiopoides]